MASAAMNPPKAGVRVHAPSQCRSFADAEQQRSTVRIANSTALEFVYFSEQLMGE